MASDKVRSYGSGTYYEKKGSPNFYWAFTYEGRQYGNKSTGIRVSTKRAAINEVEAFVAARVAEIKAGTVSTSNADVTVERMVELYLDDLSKRTHDSNAQSQLRLLQKRFKKRTVNSLTTLDLREYREDREDSGICPRTVNRELAYLRAAMNYGHDQFTPRLVNEVPKFPMESEAGNAREGFLEPEGYDRLVAELPPSLRPILVVGYHIGSRRGEMLKLEWKNVDLQRGTIFFPGKTTKSGEGRIVPIWGPMGECLREQLRIRDECFPSQGRVFFWHDDHQGHASRSVAGAPLNDFRRSWSAACERAGVPNLLVHDLRRTACRLLIKSGLSEKEAMTITGHKTAAVFKRYEIVSDADVVSLGSRLQERNYGTDLRVVPRRKAEAI